MLKKEECSICLEPIINEKKILTCDHIFHIDCIDKWASTNPSCPMCRKNINQKLNVIYYFVQEEMDPTLTYHYGEYIGRPPDFNNFKLIFCWLITVYFVMGLIGLLYMI